MWDGAWEAFGLFDVFCYRESSMFKKSPGDALRKGPNPGIQGKHPEMSVLAWLVAQPERGQTYPSLLWRSRAGERIICHLGLKKSCFLLSVSPPPVSFAVDMRLALGRRGCWAKTTICFCLRSFFWVEAVEVILQDSDTAV